MVGVVWLNLVLNLVILALIRKLYRRYVLRHVDLVERVATLEKPTEAP